MSLYHIITNRFVKPVIESHEARGEARGETIGEARGEARGEAIGEARGEARGEAIGEARGHAAERKMWRDWLDRKNAAESQGLPFDEPPPDEQP